MAPPTISADVARRFLVRRHLLDPPRALRANPESVLEVVRHLGSLQFDPLEVPGARNHELVLHARIDGYRHGWCERFLYAPPDERRLFEAYNKSLNILPLDDLPFHRVAWARARARHDGGVLAERRAATRTILARIRAEGPLSTAAFRDSHRGRVDWLWAPAAEGRAILEALFMTGRVGIARRDGNRRSYDLIERLFPPELLGKRESIRASMRHRVLSRHRAHGLLGPGGSAETFLGTGTAAERAAHVDALVDAGALVPVSVEGLRRPRYVLAEERALLERLASEGEGEGDAGRPRSVTFLAPLDPLLWDRRLLRALFDFEYVWEVYVPEAKRLHGYYVLPILFGSRLIGRIEPRLDRAAGVLRIAGVWLERGFDPSGAPDLVPAVAAAVEAFRVFVGAERVVWPRSKAARALTAT